MTATRPALVLRGEEQVFYANLREHKLTFQHCDSCSSIVYYRRTVCPHCGSESLADRESAGRGVLYSFTTQYRAAHPHFVDDVPYSLGLVDLDEGFRAFATIIGSSDAELRVGMPMELVFDDVSDGLTLMRFVVRT